MMELERLQERRTKELGSTYDKETGSNFYSAKVNATVKELDAEIARTRELIKFREEMDNLSREAPSMLPATEAGVGGVVEPDSLMGLPPEAQRDRLADWRTKFNDKLSTDLRATQLETETKYIEVEKELAKRTILSSEAQAKKNELEQTSLLLQRMRLELALKEAQQKGDKVSIEKVENDLLENSVRMRKQEEQTSLAVVQARAAENQMLADWVKAASDAKADREFELSLLGKTKTEIEQLTAARALELKLKEATFNSDGTRKITPELEENLKKVADRQRAESDLYIETQNTFMSGWDRAFSEYKRNATDYSQIGSDAFNKSINTMTDALVEFATTGKLSFGDFARSVIADLLRIQSQQLAMQMLGGSRSMIGTAVGFLGNMIAPGSSGMFGNVGTALSYGTNVGSQQTAMLAAQDFGLRLANGGAFESRNLVHAFANGGVFTNDVVTSPTYFRFGTGGQFGGLMGEAGPEAVMPLGRDSQGKLGVHLASPPPQPQTQVIPAPQMNVRVVNAFDVSTIGDYIGSTAGEKIIMNVVKKNPSMIRQLSRG
jgi:lambda family phage tail tape measure protein